MERLLKLVRPTDGYSFLLNHIGLNSTAGHSYMRVISDYKAQVRWVKDLGSQVVFSSLPLIMVEEHGVNDWREGACSWLCINLEVRSHLEYHVQF